MYVQTFIRGFFSGQIKPVPYSPSLSFAMTGK